MGAGRLDSTRARTTDRVTILKSTINCCGKWPSQAEFPWHPDLPVAKRIWSQSDREVGSMGPSLRGVSVIFCPIGCRYGRFHRLSSKLPTCPNAPTPIEHRSPAHPNLLGTSVALRSNGSASAPSRIPGCLPGGLGRAFD
jgi:hypothetical protein